MDSKLGPHHPTHVYQPPHRVCANKVSLRTKTNVYFWCVWIYVHLVYAENVSDHIYLYTFALNMFHIISFWKINLCAPKSELLHSRAYANICEYVWLWRIYLCYIALFSNENFWMANFNKHRESRKLYFICYKDLNLGSHSYEIREQHQAQYINKLMKIFVTHT